jgi:hypothetical protein
MVASAVVTSGLWLFVMGLVIPGFYDKTMYSLYAWPKINCSTHTAQNCPQITKCHE